LGCPFRIDVYPMLRFFSRILLLALFGWLPLQAVSAPKFEDSMAQRTLACWACRVTI